MNHCCEDMHDVIEQFCPEHHDPINPFDCSDSLIYYFEKFNEYGIIIHDGSESWRVIAFCPFCGSKLPESKRPDL